jgi:small subunit ribosomal protein S3Ae
MAGRNSRKKGGGWKAKKWYRVYVPDAFGKVEIGDTISADPRTWSAGMTRHSAKSCRTTRSPHQMKFKINNVAGDAAYTDSSGTK